MPHALGRPSFMANDAGPMISSSRTQFDVPNYNRHSYEKVNVNNRPAACLPTKNIIYGNGLHRYSDVVMNETDGKLATGGEMIHDLSLNTIANKKPSQKSTTDWSSSNGSTFSGHETFSVGVENERKALQNGSSQNSYTEKNSITSAASLALNTSVDRWPLTNLHYEASRTNSLPTPISMDLQNASSEGFTSIPTPSSSSHIASQSVPDTSSQFPCESSGSPTHISNSILPSSTLPPHLCPPPLKLRDTLQVPKVGHNRTAEEDGVCNSGRYSPTTANHNSRRGSLATNPRNTQSVCSNIPHEEILPDDDALIWAEAVRQKRASKRRKRDEDDDDRVIVGTKVDQNHVNWVTAYNMLTGIRFTVSRTNAKIDRPLTNADFEARHKFSFDITGNELTPSAKYDFKFKDYAPWVFRYLRAKFKLDPADYLVSLTSKYILSELGSPGKSGSFFYFSRDYKYIIKTIHHSEHKFLRKILKEYYAHVQENPNTLLSQFYGLHRVKMPYGRKIHFVVMNNLFPPHRDIHHTFDLKGSTIGRDFREEDLAKNPRATLKDLNWLRRDLHLEFGPEKKRLFFEQMEKDVQLLQRLGIMDYSMLVGIHNLQIGNQENLRDKTLQVFQPGGDTTSEEIERGNENRGSLLRTPSKLENARKARELRQIIKQEKPIPMGESSSRMPDTLEENTAKKELLFYGDDGGFQATHEDNSPGEQIFFLSIIDCLTHYGTIKKLEHFWKGLKHDKRLISPVSPDPYAERFIDFIETITKSPEEARRDNIVDASIHTSVNINPTVSPEINQRISIDEMQQQESFKESASQKNSYGAIREEYHQRGEIQMHEIRNMTNNRSLSTDRNGGLQGPTLPVVRELGESSNASAGPNICDNESRPATPPKDPVEYNYHTSIKKSAHISHGKRPLSTCSLDKKLPPLPTQVG
ncbi:BgTH12-00379 [Blumeria graminis f. sp. triticale]|uniref:1-phosphatidylinositol-4-phosphate 5-kinase n=2 Tax=Blumeria graminis TaxID=34373 RepID=A0A9W4GHG7_BLUGR|nr:BgTH12-00379 [Blumeria graminis f. sp. triticale]